MTSLLSFVVQVADADAARAQLAATAAACEVVVSPSLRADEAVVLVRGGPHELSLRVGAAAVGDVVAALHGAHAAAATQGHALAAAERTIARMMAEHGQALLTQLEDTKARTVAQAAARDHDNGSHVLRYGAWRERVRFELQRGHRAGEAMGLVLVDLDGFGAVNDAHGYVVGDAALRLVARVLPMAASGAHARPCVLGRDVADAFGILVPVASPDVIEAIADRAREAVQQAPFVNVRVTASVAAAVVVPAADARASTVLATLAARAQALCRAGGNRIDVRTDWQGRA